MKVVADAGNGDTPDRALAVRVRTSIVQLNTLPRCLSPDQHSIVAACDNGQFYVWQVGGSIAPDYILRQPELRRTFLTPDGGTVVTLSKSDSRHEIVVQHWESHAGQPVGKPLLLPYTVLMADAQGSS